MKRLQTYSALTQVTSTVLNGIQDRALSSQAANSNNAISSSVLGGESLFWQGQVIHGQLLKIDDYNDWRDRLVHGWGRALDVDADRVGQSSDYNLNGYLDPGLSGSDGDLVRYFHGYTGTGAYSTTGAATAVSNGNPPVNGAATVRSYYLQVAYRTTNTVNIAMYCDPTTGALYLYNLDASADVYVILHVFASAKTGLR